MAEPRYFSVPASPLLLECSRCGSVVHQPKVAVHTRYHADQDAAVVLVEAVRVLLTSVIELGGAVAAPVADALAAASAVLNR